jgi:uncharacterized protein
MAINGLTASAVERGSGNTIAQPAIEQWSLRRLLALHLLPGSLTTAFYIAAAPVVMRIGFPPLFAILLAIVLIVIPFEIGFLLREGKRLHGRWTLDGVIWLREPLGWGRLIGLAVAVLIVSNLVAGPAAILQPVISDRVWGWLPSWYFLHDPAQYAPYSRGTLIATLALSLLLNCFVAPIVEELYFRGYLLPRMSRFGGRAPLINVVLFALYHGWQPYAYLTITLALLPMVYAVWWKRNIYLGMVVHCLTNTIGTMLLFAIILRS